MNIPKIIHYCWFGRGEKSESVKKCINSWKEKCPDFEIIEWNEDNFHYQEIPYAKEAYEAKKWAFVSDVARLHALNTLGGIYLDTDVEIIKPFTDLMDCSLLLGLESDTHVSTAFIGAVKHQPLLEDFYAYYEGAHFLKEDGKVNTTTNVHHLTKLLKERGLFNKDGSRESELHIYPSDYFSPKDYKTGEMTITENTRAIHYFDNSWWTEEQKYRNRLNNKLEGILPSVLARKVSRIIARNKYNSKG